jgi:hypothetical protein
MNSKYLVEKRRWLLSAQGDIKHLKEKKNTVHSANTDIQR